MIRVFSPTRHGIPLLAIAMVSFAGWSIAAKHDPVSRRRRRSLPFAMRQRGESSGIFSAQPAGRICLWSWRYRWGSDA